MLILVGLQAVSFAIIGRRFASRYGFIPKSETFDAVLEFLTLERILTVAVLLVVAGLSALIWGIGQWASEDFGALDLSSTMRAMIVVGDDAGRRHAAGADRLHVVDHQHPAAGAAAGRRSRVEPAAPLDRQRLTQRPCISNP